MSIRIKLTIHEIAALERLLNGETVDVVMRRRLKKLLGMCDEVIIVYSDK